MNYCGLFKKNSGFFTENETEVKKPCICRAFTVDFLFISQNCADFLKGFTFGFRYHEFTPN